MRARRQLLALICIVSLPALAALVGCDGSSQTSTTQPGGGSGAGASANEIRVGEYGSMTGSEATFGVSTHQGIALAVKEKNAAGGVKGAGAGKKIHLISYDDQGKSQEVVTAVTRLIQQDNVVALLGEVASSRSIAGGQVAQRYGVPMITPSSTNPQVTEIGDMIFRVCFIDPFKGFVGASFAKNQLKLDKAATLYNRAQAYSAGLNEEFIKNFGAMVNKFGPRKEGPKRDGGDKKEEKKPE
jgi:branched-chain amino acid transport system substrate-binding protein